MSTEGVKTKKRYVIFNKHNGVLFSFEDDKETAESYNKEHFIVKEITLRPQEYFFGDYYTGKIYSNEEKPLIREDEMEEKFYQDIINHYSLIKQILFIVGVLEKNENLVKSEGFKEYANFLRRKKIRFDESLNAVRNDKDSFNFVSIKYLEELTKKRMEGIT
jgi:hypothetical protein